MTAQNERITAWMDARDASEKLMQPLPKDPRARFHRQMTVFGDAMWDVVNRRLLPESEWQTFCMDLDIANKIAVRTDESPLFDDLAKVEIYSVLAATVHMESIDPLKDKP